jgi:chemotaxis protein methyltransferase CheR
MEAYDELEMRLLLDAIYQRFHYDFRQYGFASVSRRLKQAARALGCNTYSSVQDRVRDPAFFLALRQQIVPVLRTYPSIKLWIAGCSTGEEVYSFAILLREEGLLDKSILYATDINPEALRSAEAGIYPLDRMRAFTQNHQASGAPCSLATYYTAKYGSAVFDRSLRKNVVFADHSLATDAVFTETQVISCRNVLIYFQRELQDRALTLFRDSLCPRGFLGLGAKESLRFSQSEPYFDVLMRQERWYQRR